MKRRLTEEERRLWSGAMRSVRPLRQRGTARGPSDTPPASAPAITGHEGTFKPSEASRPEHSGPAVPTLPLAPLARRERQRLSRGHSPIDARMDLHGLTQAQAHRALLDFLRRMQGEGAKFVLVITGTGARGSDGERGVLRRQVPLWLGLPEFRPYVVGFESAHTAHGGAGALYVRLRRGRG